MNLAERVKNYEQQFNSYIPYDKFIIIRIDGHRFSKYSKTLKKPFDDTFTSSMINVAKALLKEFNASIAYVASDEITLVLKPQFITNTAEEITNTQIYAGRVLKLNSLVAGFASALFYKLQQPNSITYFDSRVFYVDNASEAFNCILWRQRDYIRNSKMMYARSYISHSMTQNKSSDEVITECKQVTGNDWYELNDTLKYGTFLTKHEEWNDKIKYSEDVLIKMNLIN